MKTTSKLALAAIAGLATVASAQTAITSYSGGTYFDVFYGASTGDAIGYRFTVNDNIVMNNVGMWNGTQSPADGVVSTSHAWGLWDSNGDLVTSGIIDPNNGFQQGDFFYSNVDSATALAPNVRYTLAVVYAAGDMDGYLSSVSSITSDPMIDISVGVFPASGDLGLTFPANDSAGNPGRLGPNFTFTPAPGSLALLGLGGLAVTRRRR
ncbi:MAG: PEP-CTERM sorting domain-containing protein [Phycisphaerales bacterium JB037]